MKLLSIYDVKELIKEGKKTALVLKWKSEERTFGYWPVNLLQAFYELAQKKVEAGEFVTIEQAMEHLEKSAYICTEEDYNTSQEHLHD